LTLAFAWISAVLSAMSEDSTIGNDNAGPDGTLESSPGTLAGATEATEGLAPEITTHSEQSIEDGSELSPEEKALQVNGQPLIQNEGDEDRKDFADEDDDAAALAEGRVDPPLAGRDEPVQP